MSEGSPNLYRRKTLINEPLLILFVLTAEQVVPAMIGLAIGMLMKNTLPFLALAIAYIYISQKIKVRFTRGAIRHKAWAIGIIPTTPSKSLPDPIVKLFHR